MPTPTYTALANITLGSATSSVTFSSIPATGFRDLIFAINGQTGSNANVIYRINGDGGSNYSHVHMTGNSSTSSGAGTFGEAYATYGSVLNGTRLIINLNFLDYSATDKHKTALVRNGYTNSAASVASVEALAIRWANTTALSSIVFSTNAGSFASGSTFALYGIAS
jgi:hypothetical protein